jgi:hypothetical protein
MFPTPCTTLGPSLRPAPLRQATAALRLALAAAALARAVAQPEYCALGSSTACAAVGIVYGSSYGRAVDLQYRLRGTGAFATVETLDASSETPTLAQLGAYHAVVAFSDDRRFGDGALLGDRLAAYHDGGGGVVVTAHERECGPPLRIGGAYGTPGNGYALLNRSAGCVVDNGTDSLGAVVEDQSPLMVGVASFNASYSPRSTAPVIEGSGVVVARWSGGGQEPLVVRGERGNRTLVELNFFPVSAREWPRFWTGNGAALLRNALKHSRCVVCGPGTFAAAGAARAGRADAGELARMRESKRKKERVCECVCE